MKTYSVKSKDTKDQNWYIIDAQGLVLGRTACLVAKMLLGKHKPLYSPCADVGDNVIVVNSDQIKVTGSKYQNKLYYTHSGKPGNLKTITLEKLIQKSSEKLLKIAVKGMLPKNTRGRDMLKKLKVYKGLEHPHVAQQPIPIQF